MRLAPLRRLGLWWVLGGFALAGLGLVVLGGRLRVGGFVIGVGLLVFSAFFLVRTCAPADGQIGGGRAASCPGP